MLSPQAKATILGIGKPPPPRTPWTIDLHDMSAADYLQFVQAHQQHPLTAPVTATNTITPSVDSSALVTPDPAPPDLEAHATERPPPGDLHHVLGNRKPSSSSTSSDEITLNGK